MRPGISLIACFFLLWAMAAGSARAAEAGLTAGSVRLGILMPFSNVFAEVGSAYMSGARAAVEEINHHSGVLGRRIELAPFDTMPIPADTLEQAQEALQNTAADEQVFALLGTVGQANAAALVPTLQNAGVPLIGAATGLASQLPDAGQWIFPVRRRDEDVILGLVKLLSTMSATRLAVVHPRTSDAQTQMQLLQEAVKSTKVTLVAQLDVGETNTELGSQVKAILAARPDSVLSLGSYQMTEALVRQSRDAGYKGLFVTHSDVGTLRLMATLKALSRGMGVASGLPSPYSVTLQAAREFRAAMERLPEASRHDLDEASFEGYLAVRVFAEAFRKSGSSPTRKELRQVLTSQVLNVSGLSFDFRRAADRGLQTPGSLYVMTREGRVSQ
jgi:ABC-type branched-subunit amino acid transport system substrate-binding protein